MTDPAAQFAAPRVATGALFVEPGEVLLVRKTYGYRWVIPDIDSRRLRHAYQAQSSGDTAYREFGEPTLALQSTS